MVATTDISKALLLVTMKVDEMDKKSVANEVVMKGSKKAEAMAS